MAALPPGTHTVTLQPQYVISSDPFRDMNQEWTVGLCECCNDVGQCKKSQLI